MALFIGASVLSSAAEARAGRSIGALRKSPAVPTPVKTVPPGEARAASTRGNVNVVVPVPIRRGEPRPAVNGAAAAQPVGLAAPARPVSAAGPALSTPAVASRPWCEGGNVVGGLCLLN